MSIIPISFDSGTQTYTMHDQDNNHIFDVLLSDLPYGKNIDGSPNFDMIEVACRDCPNISWHPVGGGAAPFDIQIMFLRHEFYEVTAGPEPIRAMVMALDHIPDNANTNEKITDVIDAIHERVTAMDGESRFALDDDTIKKLTVEFRSNG